jgi:hypothetical protein
MPLLGHGSAYHTGCVGLCRWDELSQKEGGALGLLLLLRELDKHASIESRLAARRVASGPGRAASLLRGSPGVAMLRSPGRNPDVHIFSNLTEDAELKKQHMERLVA